MKNSLNYIPYEKGTKAYTVHLTGNAILWALELDKNGQVIGVHPFNRKDEWLALLVNTFTTENALTINVHKLEPNKALIVWHSNAWHEYDKLIVKSLEAHI